MLELKVHDGKDFVPLRFEHSLRSLSKWESRYKKAWHSNKSKTFREMLDYFGDMLLDGADPNSVILLAPEQMEELNSYIQSEPTASSVNDSTSEINRETVTSELIYYWLVELGIPWEAQDWHLNRLMMLIRITNFKRKPHEKANPRDLHQRFDDINERNKKILGTKG